MGRHKEFDPDEALEKAMTYFWRHGYNAASMQDLQKAMSLNSFSIYATFGDKRSLYLAALKRYRALMEREIFRPLRDSDEGLQPIIRFFQAMAANLSTPNGARGCLMLNTGVEKGFGDREIQKIVGEALTTMHKAVLLALERARKNGELRAGMDLPDCASFVVTQSQGMVATTRASVADIAGASARFVVKEIESWRNQAAVVA